MITKREILKHIIETKGLCKIDNCKVCPYWKNSLCRKIKVVGAMAILRMFREKKKTLLSVGTKIRFDNGKTATIVNIHKLSLLEFGEFHHENLSYLIGRTWEVEE